VVVPGAALPAVTTEVGVQPQDHMFHVSPSRVSMGINLRPPRETNYTCTLASPASVPTAFFRLDAGSPSARERHEGRPFLFPGTGNDRAGQQQSRCFPFRCAIYCLLHDTLFLQVRCLLKCCQEAGDPPTSSCHVQHGDGGLQPSRWTSSLQHMPMESLRGTPRNLLSPWSTCSPGRVYKQLSKLTCSTTGPWQMVPIWQLILKGPAST
jgi:hypothetical protein